MIRQFFIGRGGVPDALTSARPGARRARRRRPAIEALEGRALLSLVGPEQQVSLNTQPTDNFESSTASSNNGTSVAVWVNAYSQSDHDIWAQRFDQNGQPTGAPIQVDFTTANSYLPRVAMDGFGRFAVTWQNVDSLGNSSIMMRYFDASGTPIIPIATIASGHNDYQPAVAASNGSFVITWVHVYSTTDHDIYAERFVISSGVPLAQGTFGVNFDTNDEEAPSVAMAPDGRFDIAYMREYSSSDWDIFASQYAGNGSLIRSMIPINNDGNSEASPSISMDNGGNAVVAYDRLVNDWGVAVNRLSSTGVVGPMITVQDVTGVDELDPTVALLPTGGRFVVSFEFLGSTEVTEFDSNNLETFSVWPLVGNQPSLTLNSFGQYFVTYTRYDTATGHQDIFGQRGLLTVS
jgi:hypothetical protein